MQSGMCSLYAMAALIPEVCPPDVGGRGNRCEARLFGAHRKPRAETEYGFLRVCGTLPY